MQAPDFALEHQDARLTLALAADAHLSSLWDRVDPNDIVLSWLVQLPEATLTLTGAQLAAANLAEGFVADSAVAEGISELPEADVIPRAFAGVASDGRQLANLLAQPALGSLAAIKSGHDAPRSLAMGRASLSMIAQTQVADAGRGADQVALTGYRQLRGYVRVAQGGACSRCIILAGRVYAWSSGFKRHPNCHCVMLPLRRAELAGIKQTPQQLYSLLTSAERRAAGWSLADQAAIDAGADIFQVTNARAGMYTAGGRRFTTVGTSRRAIYGGYDIDSDTGELIKRPRGARRKGPRLTVDQIFADARDRDEAIALLRRNGYLIGKPAMSAPGRELIVARPAAAAGAVDPALKLTVAQLKQIAKDANVPLYGATRKADIVRALRDRESVYATKIPGLPEWKPPKPILGADIDAPPLGIPAADRVLSGSALNDWADHFKYDRQYKRFQFVDANGNTPPEGIRVNNLRANIQSGGEYMVHDGTAFSFDGVAYLIEHRADQFGSPWVSKTLADLRAAHESIPAAKLANKSYAALGGDNPADVHWRVKYNNPHHTSIAMAGDGHVTLWQFRGPVSAADRLYSRVPIDVLRHETGHNLDSLVGRTVKGSESQAWRDAAKADASAAAKIRDLSDEIPGHGDFAKVEAGRGFPEGVTDYGRSSVAEDYAESVRLYQQGVIAQGRLTAGAEKGAIYFRDLYPERAKILDDLFPDLAKAQKAEIAAARAPKPVVPKSTADLSKLKVPELRALAKERGITGYSKLTKPQLLEKLGGKAEVKAAVKAPEKDLVTLARQRQADIDYARARAELLSETEEWLNNQGTMASMAIQLRRDALRYGIEGHKDMAALFRAIDAGDEAKVRKAIEAVAKKQKLTRIDRAGEVVKFDRSLHGDIGKDLKPGEWAIVVRPGYSFDRNGELIRLHKAKVEKATAEEVRASARQLSVRRAGEDLTDKLLVDNSWVRTAQERNLADRTHHSDRVLSGLVDRQAGWTTRGRIVESAQIDEAVRKGWTQMWRGVRREHAEVQELAGIKRGPGADAIIQRDRIGKWEMGHGLYGNGKYFSVRRTTAEAYRGSEIKIGFARDATSNYGPGPLFEWNPGRFNVKEPRALLRVALDPDARIIDYDDLKAEHLAFLQQARSTDLMQHAGWNNLENPLLDSNFYAVMRGYDGVRIRGRDDGTPYPPGHKHRDSADQYVIFNRSVLIFEKASDRYDA